MMTTATTRAKTTTRPRPTNTKMTKAKPAPKTATTAQNTNTDDRMVLEDTLSLLKGNATLYMNGAIEAACPKINAAFKKVLDENLTMQHKVYEAMEARGWYKTTAQKKTEIDKVKKKFANAS